MQPIEIHLLGEFSVQVNGRSLPALNADRPKTLLAYLLLHRHSPQPRRHLAFLLWPDSTEAQALSNLRYLLHTLRQALPDADSYLAADKLTLQWRPQLPYRLDVADFEEALLAAAQTTDPPTARRWLEQAISHYRGDLLPANYDDWLIPLRDDLARRYQAALIQLVDLLTEAGDYQSAANYAQQLAQQDPLNEGHTIRLMRLYALAGERSAIRRVYQQCASTLEEELGLEPEAATQAAYKEALAQAAAPSAPLPVVAAPMPRPLPQPATPFLGREVELREIGRLLADPHCRLLTITGPGGMGKTRLALQTAVVQQPHFRDGVAYISLRPLNSADFLAATIASALNMTLSGQPDIRGQLLHLLARREMLLLLDNFEHLLDGVDLIADILAQASGVKLLVTSRQRLDLQEEWSFALGEFNLPAAPTAAEMEASSAVALFTQSARRAATDFNLTPADYEPVVRICRLVGGLPLGIELAASWTRLLSCAEIAQELEQGLDFLAVNTRNMPPQHQNLRAVFDQSWALLTPAEQQLLQTLTIFQGSFTRPAAAAVAEATLPLLSGLIDKSLLRRQGPDRYSLHELIRQYAAERLRAAEVVYQAARAKHGRYTLQWLAEQATVLRGPGQKDGLTAVSAELANIRTAWEWAASQRQADLLRLAAFSLFYFYELRGLLHEGEAAFRLAAESLPQDTDAAGRESQAALSAMQTYQAHLSFRTGKMALAETLLRQTIARLQTVTDDTTLGYAARQLGLIDWSLGRFDEALNLLQTSLTLAEQQEDHWGKAMAQVYLGLIMQDRGELSAARQQLTAVQPAVRALGDPRLLGNALLIAGRTNLLLGHLAEAEEQLITCLEATRETNDPNSIIYATHYLGLVKQAQGDLPAARQFIEQSVALFTQFNDLVGLERASVTLGFLEIDTGDFEMAQSHFLTFLRARQRHHAVRYILAAVLGTAVVRAQFGDPFTALVWTLSVLQHPGLDWESGRRGETLRAELQAQLTAEQIALAQQEAAGQSFDATVSSIVGQ